MFKNETGSHVYRVKFLKWHMVARNISTTRYMGIVPCTPLGTSSNHDHPIRILGLSTISKTSYQSNVRNFNLHLEEGARFFNLPGSSR